MNHAELKRRLDTLYRHYSRPEFISPDPLECLYRYDRREDREVAGLVAALLAYGGVKQIVAGAGRALSALGDSPARFVRERGPDDIRRSLRGFRHRWTTGGDVAAVLRGVAAALRLHGSLENSFLVGYEEDEPDILPALSRWVGLLRREGGEAARRDLLACPAMGSACKRLNLFLRWMVRCDEVDPGLWPRVSPSKLIVPLDLHMHRIALGLDLTRRRQADLKAAIEVTRAFASLRPEDPVRYDFALTRASMRGDRDLARMMSPAT